MAREVKLNSQNELDALRETLLRAIQSAHLNFLFGAGASSPGVPTAGDVETEITKHFEAGEDEKAEKKAAGFLKQIAQPMKALMTGSGSGSVAQTLEQYARFIQTIDKLLSERKTSLLPKQASVFTTNYDLFLERASEDCPSIILNDGFNRIPRLTGRPIFASEKLFDATMHTGNLYDYRAELASLNLIKLHGSLSWKKTDNDIVFDVVDVAALANLSNSDEKARKAILSSSAIVLPTHRKHQQTIIERTYYDLLRIFANVMDREGTLLIAFGFSFRDEHIFEIVKRALRNPTLLLIICCYSLDDVAAQNKHFASYNNVLLLVPGATGDLNFARLNELLSDVVNPRVAP